MAVKNSEANKEKDVFCKKGIALRKPAEKTAATASEEQLSTDNISYEAIENNMFSNNILKQFYARKDSDGKPIETAKDVINRVHQLISKMKVLTEAERYQLKEAIAEFALVPSSPILMNASTDLGQLSACFVLPVNDSMEEIYDAIKYAAIVHKSGGGTGFSFTNIRGTGTTVKTTGGVASGPLSFMNVFNASTDTIKQGGKRRGANMGILNVDHLDIEKFIQCKMDGTSFTNFNISVGITEEFIHALAGHSDDRTRRGSNGAKRYGDTDKAAGGIEADFRDDSAEKQKFLKDNGITEGGEYYYRINDGIPKSKKMVVYKDSHKIMQMIVECAYKNGDPGLFFVDKTNLCSPTEELIESTNPCGEIPLLPYEACNLSAINLMKCITTNSQGKLVLDTKKLDKLTRLGIMFLNGVIDNNQLPIQQIQQMVARYRKTGLGIMGFGDMCYKLGIAYGSPESVVLATQISKQMSATAKTVSSELYERYGDIRNTGFRDIWRDGDYDANQEYIKGLYYAKAFYDQDASCGNKEIDEAWNNAFNVNYMLPVLNYCKLTAAPTGTTGILANTSGGIEPNFALVYTRLVNGTDRYRVLNPVFEEALEEYADEETGLAFGMSKSEIIEELYNKGSILNCEWAPAEMKRVFVCAQDVDYIQHLQIMEAFQRYIDNSVSKTINMNNSATMDDVYKAYTWAIAHNLKGITIYRDGSRDNQVLSTKQSSQSSDAGKIEEAATEAAKREADKKADNDVAVGNKEPVSKDTVGASEKYKDFEGSLDINEDNEVITYRTDITPRHRALVMSGKTAAIRTGCGKLYVTVNCDDRGIAEIFTGTGSNGGCESQSVALSKIISVALRSGVSPEEIKAQLMGITCKAAQRNSDSQCMSCPDAIGRAISMMLANEAEPKLLNKKVTAALKKSAEIPMTTATAEVEIKPTEASAAHCPECGEQLAFMAGCVTCNNCGWSKCN